MPNDDTLTLTAPAAAAVGAVPADLTERLRQLRDALLTGLVERDVAIRLALLAALAGEHILLVGPPGTAKSMVARRLRLAFEDASYFERLLTRFTVPEELFGPLSIKGLEEDRYERLTASYLPTASVAFLDEIFKANSAILNALLTLLNEREFDNGAQRVHTPLVSVVGASNELGDSEELDALFDRFLLRLHVGPVSRGAFLDLLGLRGHPQPVVNARWKLSARDLLAIQAAADAVKVPDDVQVLLCELRDWVSAEGVAASDRRWRKIVKLLQVAALTNGRSEVSIWDCWLLQHCLWDAPEEREAVYKWYSDRVGASAAMDPSRLTAVVAAWEGQLKADQESQSQARDEQGRPVFVRADGKASVDDAGDVWLHEGKQPLYLAPPGSWKGRYHNGPVSDRKNGGKGFTEAALAELYVDEYTAFAHWNDRASYLSTASNRLVERQKWPPKMEPTRHKAIYVDACLRQLEELKAEVATYKASLVSHMARMEQDIRTHLWVTADFVEPAADALKGTAREVDTLLTRINTLRKGFELLPKEQAPRAAPAKK